MYRIKRLTSRLLYKLDALWRVLRGRGVVCNMHFDDQHPLWISLEDQECLVMDCAFEAWQGQARDSCQRIPEKA